MSSEAGTGHAGITTHACVFPRPFTGAAPKPCECGRTYAMEQADLAFAAAAAQAARVFPLPPALWVTGVSGGQWHAIDRDFAQRMIARDGRRAAIGAECGTFTAVAWSHLPWDRAALAHFGDICPDCYWRTAASLGDLHGALRDGTPRPGELAVLARLLPDPLIAVTAQAMLLEAAESGYTVTGDPDSLPVLQVLAAISRHSPMLLADEECAEGSCPHPPADPADPGGPCESPGASVACPACSLQTGDWAGEWEGQCRPETVIAAPCQVLTTLAAYAAKTLEDTRQCGKQGRRGDDAPVIRAEGAAT